MNIVWSLLNEKLFSENNLMKKNLYSVFIAYFERFGNWFSSAFRRHKQQHNCNWYQFQ